MVGTDANEYLAEVNKPAVVLCDVCGKEVARAIWVLGSIVVASAPHPNDPNGNEIRLIGPHNGALKLCGRNCLQLAIWDGKTDEDLGLS